VKSIFSRAFYLSIGLLGILAANPNQSWTQSAYADAAPVSKPHWVQVQARNSADRSTVENLGMSIEAVRSDCVWGFANDKVVAKLEAQGFQILSQTAMEIGRGGHETMYDFPPQDARYHNFQQTTDALNNLHSLYADITKVISVGKSVEGRDIYALHINTDPQDLATGKSVKPGAIYMGNHHAREHLSVEIPLMMAQYLLKNKDDAQISALLKSRDIWFVPMVNPDGSEFDIATGQYQYWRKNRSKNSDGTYGVDLNRNYGYEWGTGGSDTDTSSEIYMGPAPFSEPETRAMRDFVEAHLNATVLLTFHSFSELVLYPWGHSNDPVPNTKDQQTFEKMATTMAAWNHYTPEQASALYIASGDTTDWAYGTHGIFAFTFELSPSSNEMGPGGFYPGAGIIDKVFQDNLKPVLYLLDAADNPYKVLGNTPTGMLQNYMEPKVDSAFDSPLGLN